MQTLSRAPASSPINLKIDLRVWHRQTNISKLLIVLQLWSDCFGIGRFLGVMPRICQQNMRQYELASISEKGPSELPLLQQQQLCFLKAEVVCFVWINLVVKDVPATDTNSVKAQVRFDSSSSGSTPHLRKRKDSTKQVNESKTDFYTDWWK